MYLKKTVLVQLLNARSQQQCNQQHVCRICAVNNFSSQIKLRIFDIHLRIINLY